MTGTARSHEAAMVAVLSAAFSMITFELIGVNYLIPFIVPALQLSNLQVGTALSKYWITFALVGFSAGQLTDKSCHRKRFLAIVMILFAILSFPSGLAASFLAFPAARLVMVLVEGAFVYLPS